MWIVPLVRREPRHHEHRYGDEDVGRKHIHPDIHRQRVHEREQTRLLTLRHLQRTKFTKNGGKTRPASVGEWEDGGTWGLTPEVWRKRVPVMNQKLLDMLRWLMRYEGRFHGCGGTHSYGEKRAKVNRVKLDMKKAPPTKIQMS